MSFYKKYFNTYNQISCIVFFSFIYDLIRAGYLESKRKHLRLIRKSDCLSNYFKHNYPSVPALSIVSRARKPQHTLWPGTKSASAFKRKSHRPRPRWREGLLQTIDVALNLSTKRITCLSSLTLKSGQEARTSVSNTPTRHQDNRAAPIGIEPYLQLESVLDSKEKEEFELELEQAKDDCPLKRMPKFIRAYEYLSHTLVILSFLKYVVLNLLYSELFGLQKIYSCYIPGRTAVLPEFSPSFPLIVLFYHVVYRFYLRVYRKSFHLDCFLFVLYSKEHIHSIEAQYKRLIERQQRGLASRRHTEQAEAATNSELHKLFAQNRMFFIRARCTNRKFAYKLRSNRGMKQWFKMKKFLHRYALACASNFVIWSLPLATLILFTVLSDSNFNILYGHCNQLSDQVNPNKWTWSHWQRYIWFVFDMVDSGWLLFDTANALVWPFSSMVICAQDITFSVDDLIISMEAVTKRLQIWLAQERKETAVDVSAPVESDKSSMRSPMSGVSIDRLHRKAYESIQDDILVCQSEINDILQQMCLVDDFVSKLASFTIFCWIITNIYYQIMSLTANRLLLKSAVVQFMQMTAFTAISLSFAYLSNTHSKSRRLYKQICNIVALDPSPRNKSSWLWVLEYYQESKARYSFHLGPYADLSLSNYLKSMSWLITGALVTISLFKHKHQHEIESLL